MITIYILLSLIIELKLMMLVLIRDFIYTYQTFLAMMVDDKAIVTHIYHLIYLPFAIHGHDPMPMPSNF